MTVLLVSFVRFRTFIPEFLLETTGKRPVEPIVAIVWMEVVAHFLAQKIVDHLVARRPAVFLDRLRLFLLFAFENVQTLEDVSELFLPLLRRIARVFGLRLDTLDFLTTERSASFYLCRHVLDRSVLFQSLLQQPARPRIDLRRLDYGGVSLADQGLSR